MSEAQIIREATEEAMAGAGCSFANRQVCNGIHYLLGHFGPTTTIDGVIDYLDQLKEYADIMRRHLEKNRGGE